MPYSSVILLFIWILTAILLSVTTVLRNMSAFNEAYPFPDTFWYDQANRMSVPNKETLNITVLKELSVVTVACCKDVEPFISGFRENIEQNVVVLNAYRVLLGESDSIDNSLNLLKRWSDEDNNIQLHSYGKLQRKLPIRTERIAYCQNNLLRIVRSDETLKKSDFYLVMDVNRNADITFTMAGFLTNFFYPLHSWAAMTASQPNCYYDIWALRSSIVTYDSWRMVERFYNRKLTAKNFVGVHQKPIPPDYGLNRVTSAFRGFAIYQARYLKNCTYTGSSGNHDVCEPVLFNQCINENGCAIYVNPAFINSPVENNSEVCID